MVFEIYKPRGEKVKKEFIVSLSKNAIVLNKHVREKLQAQKIELAYDKDTKTIRIKASDEGQTLKKTKAFARGFFNHFGIDKKGKFIARYDESENAIYVDIS
ncbi:hypothetical protein [Pelotomaculum propionicicum]|uniref:Uncharacterized protein n=1 Tax=Pelotomaculum propionicicum TaxID=258475 RepID=A0A4Y7RTF0_9FIRM|nr:hypothetical protein [Pelotomaculum propionicicum]NLI12138.1 hypothetical protein [Peptococcaceae bacterium]TEB12026.1 hypothetical protein Pmgp_01182 [Pelotomaculum propionicicum]